MKITFTKMVILLAIFLISSAPAGPIEDMLKQADTWIISDTGRIMAYIDSCNKLTDAKLKNSPYWSDAYRDLLFLLGIDNVGSP
jgi:hypothetical protein